MEQDSSADLSNDRVARQKVEDGVEHLQAAAQEMIEAARAFLDVVEDFVGDETRMASVADAVASVARGARRAVTPTAESPDDSPAGEPTDASVQHIRVS